MQKKVSNIAVNENPLSYDSMVGKYKEYRYGYKSREDFTTKEQLEVDILKILESLGYPIDQTGTYFYKDIIVKAMKKIQNAKTEEEYVCLIMEMNYNYSQFYFDIARNDYDIGLKTFHNCIELSYQSKKNQNSSLKRTIGLTDGKLEYKKEALLIASYIVENQAPKELSQIKRMIKTN